MTTFESRATVGLRAPKSAPRIPGPVTSVTVHYNGPKVGIDASAPHSRCRNFWVGVQRFHMDTQKWSDIAYTMGVCQHGIVMAGRGKGVRTAANGTSKGNDTSYAIFVMIGGDEKPTSEALAAVRAGMNALGEDTPKSHNQWKATGCPGASLTQWVRDGASVPIPPAPEEREYNTDLDALVEIKDILGITVGQVMDPPDRQRIVAEVRRLKG